MVKTEIIISTAISIVSGFLGFISQVLIVKAFGVGTDIDVFFASLSLPIFLSSLFTAGIMYGYLPNLISNNSNVEQQKKNAQNLFEFSVIISIFFLVCIFIIDWQIKLFVNESIADNYNIKKAFIFAWVLASIQVLITCPSALLISQKKYFSSSILSWFQYIGTIVILININLYNINIIFYGMIFGSILGLILGIYKIRNWINFRDLINLNKDTTLFKNLIKLPYTVIVISCFSVYAVIDSYWGPKIGEGVLSYIGYAQRLIIGIGNLAIIGVFTISSHEYKFALQSNNSKLFKRVINKLTLFSLIPSIFLALILYLYIFEIINLIYGSKNFSYENVQILGTCIITMLPGLVGMLVSTILMKGLFCIEGYILQKLLLGFSWPVAYFILIMLTKDMGLMSLAYSYTILWVIYAIFLYLIIIELSKSIEKS